MKNFTTPALAALFLAAGLTVGCDQSASDTASGVLDGAKDAGAAAAGAAGDAAEGAKGMAGDAVEGAKNMAGDAAEGVKNMAGDAAEGAKGMAGDAVEGVKDAMGGMVGDGKDAMGEGMDVSSLTEGMALSDEQATGMLDKVKDMISSGDTEGAGSLLEKLQTMELPEAIQPQVDKVTALLEQAKGAGNALKGLGK